MVYTHKFVMYGTQSECVETIMSDRRASWGAKGLLDYLLAPCWNGEICFADLLKVGGTNDENVETLIIELENLGYARTIRRQMSGDTWECFTEIYAKPMEVHSTNENRSTPKTNANPKVTALKPR